MRASRGSADERARPVQRGSAIGCWALVIGAGSFALFWVLAPTSLDDSVPGPPGLAVHATSIASFAVGLWLLAGGIRRPPESRTLVSVGAILVVIGQVALFPLFPIGLGCVALGLRRAGFPRGATRWLLTGSLALLVVCAVMYRQQDGRLFGADAPPLRLETKLAFQASVILIAVTLAAVGIELRRRGTSPGRPRG